MPAPTVARWMATRSSNTTAHPGAVDISMEEETPDHIPKTPAQRKRRAKSKRDVKSAEEVDAGIQRVAAYERKSLNDELVNATPQVTYTPAPPRHSPERHESSDQERGGNVSDNASYQPPSESVPDIVMSDADVGSLPSPVGKTIAKGKKGAKRGKKVTIVAREESATESDSEATPFKRVMNEQGKSLGKGTAVEPTPTKTVLKGKGKAPAVSEDSATEADSEPTVPKKTGNAKAVAVGPKRTSKAPIVDMASDSDSMPAQLVAAGDRPRPRPRPAPLKTQPGLQATTSAPTKPALKQASKLNPSKNSDGQVKKPDQPQPASKLASKPNPSKNSDRQVEKLDQPQTQLSKAKPSKPKSDIAKAKQALKDAQEAVKKAQQVQKQAREQAKKLKESTKEPGVRDRIRAVNKEVNAESEPPHPPRLSRLSKSDNSSTHQCEGTATSKPKQNLQAKTTPGHFDSIYDFGSEDDKFRLSFDSGNDDGMEIDEVEPAAKAGGSGVPKAGKKGVVDGSGLAKSGDTSGSKPVKTGEKAKKEVTKVAVKNDKEKAEKGAQPAQQVSQ